MDSIIIGIVILVILMIAFNVYMSIKILRERDQNTVHHMHLPPSNIPWNPVTTKKAPMHSAYM